MDHDGNHSRRPAWPNWLWGLLVGKTDGQFAARSAFKSVVGGRKENQDRCFCNDAAALYLVVDGMGGHQGGALASQIAIDTIPGHLEKALANRQLDHEKLQTALEQALQAAQQEMRSVASKNPDLQKMGCTLAVAAVVHDRLFFAHVGDSRVYLFQDNKIKRLTTDESLVQELLDAGLIRSDQLPTHRWRHVVTNSLTAEGMHRMPRWQELRLHEGDEVLVTSDGLTDELSDQEIALQLNSNDDPDRSVENLVSTALQREASDNVTCVVAKLTPLCAQHLAQSPDIAVLNRNTKSHRKL